MNCKEEEEGEFHSHVLQTQFYAVSHAMLVLTFVYCTNTSIDCLAVYNWFFLTYL